MPNMSNEDYLALLLKQKKLQLERLHLENQKHIFAFQTQKTMLDNDIDSLERQINVNK